MRALAWISSGEAVAFAVGLVRAKVVAVLLGPMALGLIASFSAAHAATRQAMSLGLPTSGAQLVASSDGPEQQASLSAVRLFSLAVGVLGAAVLFTGAHPLSAWLLDDVRYSNQLRWLAVVVLLESWTDGRRTALKGLHEVRLVSALEVVCIVASSASAIGLYVALGQDGIIPALIAAATFNHMFFEWGYRRKALPGFAGLGPAWARLRSLVGFGSWVAVGTLAAALGTVAIRALINRQLDLTALGLFAASQALSGRLLTLLSGVVSRDFFPRLAGMVRDARPLIPAINQQIHMNVILALPGTMLLFFGAPWLLHIFYAESFLPAVPILRWMLVAELIRAVYMPLRYTNLAQRGGRVHAAAEITLHLGRWTGAYAALQWFGLPGVGVAWAGMATFQLLLLALVAHRTAGFGFDGRSKALLAGSAAALMTLAGLEHAGVAPELQVTISAVLTGAVGLSSLRFLLGWWHSRSQTPS